MFQHVLDYVYVLGWLVIAALFGTVATTWSQKVPPVFHKWFNYPTFNQGYWQRPLSQDSNVNHIVKSV